MCYLVVVYALTCCLRTLHMRLCTRYLTTPILHLLLPALQGALNIAFIGVAWFTKQPRPYHLCTPDVQRAWEKLACRENMQECNQSAPPHFSLH